VKTLILKLVPTRRCSDRPMTKPVNFYCEAPKARAVSVIGDFNTWCPNAHPMQLRPDGIWYAQVWLRHGHHRYQFQADGEPVLDPHAMGETWNETHQRVSILAVS